LSLTTVGLTGWLGWEIKTEPVLVPYVLILGDETRVLNTIQAKAWEPNAGVYADIARRWIWHIRTKSPDALVNRANLEDAKRMTAKALGPQMQALADETAKQMKKDGLEVDIVMQTDPTLVENGSAVVDVDWRERRYKPAGGAGEWVRMSGRLHLRAIPPKTTGEIEDNPSGIYVTSFTFQRVVPPGPIAEAVQ
jgi:type IV secretory pathway TrbF-like protein